MLAKPTAASPANYKKEMCVKRRTLERKIDEIVTYLVKCVQCLTINFSIDMGMRLDQDRLKDQSYWLVSRAMALCINSLSVPLLEIPQ